MKYVIVVEKTESGFSAYCPDLEGCVAAGATEQEVERLMKEAMEFHLEGLRAEGENIPAPLSYTTYLEVKAA